MSKSKIFGRNQLWKIAGRIRRARFSTRRQDALILWLLLSSHFSLLRILTFTLSDIHKNGTIARSTIPGTIWHSIVHFASTCNRAKSMIDSPAAYLFSMTAGLRPLDRSSFYERLALYAPGLNIRDLHSIAYTIRVQSLTLGIKRRWPTVKLVKTNLHPTAVDAIFHQLLIQLAGEK